MRQFPSKSLLSAFPIRNCLCLAMFWLGCLTLTFVAYGKYQGTGYIYLLFTLISNILLYLGFRKKAIFFDAAIGVFLWLGFWLKVTVRVGFMHGSFHEPTGAFDGSGAAFDRGLLVSSCGMFALIVAAYIRGIFFYYEKAPSEIAMPGIFALYQKHRKMMMAVFILMILGVTISNIYFGIYQRGQVPKTILPYRLGGIYTWLLLFGLASFGAVMLHFEYIVKRSNSYLLVMLILFEGFASNVSLLSRGMILNATAVFYGLYRNLKLRAVKKNLQFFAVVFATFCVLFLGSIAVVNYLRYTAVIQHAVVASAAADRVSNTIRVTQASSLFLDRWVGIEGVLAVSSSKKEGWDLWQQGWAEMYVEGGTSFFDLNLIDSPYLTIDTSVYHYISLPGIIAFCFYPGSFPFLFVCLMLAGAIGAATEIIVYRIGGRNLILCSLLAQVVAYRFMSFGYVPAQSYLLFGSIFLNLLIIYGAEKFLERRQGTPFIGN